MNLPINKIICGDCLEVMKDWPDNCVDLVLTDPDYDISDNAKICKQGNEIKTNKQMWGHWEKLTFEDLIVRLEKIYRVNSGSIVVYYDRFEISKLKDRLQALGYYPKNLIGFLKVNPLPNFRQAGFRSDIELAVYCQKEKGKDTFNFLSQQEMVSVDKVTIGNKFTSHETEKPLYPFLKYVRVMSNPNDLILDPFCGSGTTCVAAKMLGRRYIGIDISEEYCQIARDRLEAVETGVPVKEARKGQLALFGGQKK